MKGGGEGDRGERTETTASSVGGCMVVVAAVKNDSFSLCMCVLT
jgi:hypothetical protein